MGKYAKFLVIFLVIFLVGCVENFDEISIDNGEELIKVNVEISDDSEERAKGLMFRERLDENAGMFFIFDKENYQSFWMKNTLIPLDIIFIDENLEIVNIENAVPCTGDPCALYKSAEPSQYVLEVNEGFAERNSINVGDKVLVEDI